MELLIHFLFALVLLSIAWSLALSYLAGPMAMFKKTGVLRAGRGASRLLWRGFVGIVRLLFGRRRFGIRQTRLRAPTRRF
jgi:hypothetical protein